MLIFAYKNELGLKEDNLVLKDILIHKGETIETNLNILYYEDYFVININEPNLIEKYLEKKDLIIEVPIIDIDKVIEVKKKLKEIDREIEYSVVSRGTEKNGNKGYIEISKLINNKRLLVVQDHEDRFIHTLKDSMDSYNYDIHNIAFSRFEMISALSLNKIKFSDNILLCGLGNIGITALVFLLDNKYKNINIYTNEIKPYIINIIDKLNLKYNSKIKLIDKIDGSYNTYIDTTGASEVLEKIFNTIEINKIIFLIGTPREQKYLIDPLLIHRNNLIVIGGHELRGITKNERIEIYEKLLKENKKNDLIKSIVNINKYKKNLLNDLLTNKNHFIEVIKYDNKD